MADLVMDHVTVEFKSAGYIIKPLDGFTATVPDGTLAVLLGPSGCGKTTLLSCLGGILTPTSGSIRYGDTEISSLRGAELQRYRQHRVGIVFQAFNLVPSLNATENVMAPLAAAGVRRGAARTRAVELLEQVGLGDRRHHSPRKLSGGQQQRVSFARALAHDPPIVIADEPTASLDYVQVETVLRLLRDLASRGRVVVVATHDERLIPLADQVIEMVPKFRDQGVDVLVSELAADEVLFRQGSRGNRIYIIDSGEVDIVRENADGTEEVIVRLGPGEHFGEMGPLFGIARSATARAATVAKVSGYTTEQFRSHLGVSTLTDLIR